jgi:hypothetical protein
VLLVDGRGTDADPIGRRRTPGLPQASVSYSEARALAASQLEASSAWLPQAAAIRAE